MATITYLSEFAKLAWKGKYVIIILIAISYTLGIAFDSYYFKETPKMASRIHFKYKESLKFNEFGPRMDILNDNDDLIKFDNKFLENYFFKEFKKYTKTKSFEEEVVKIGFLDPKKFKNVSEYENYFDNLIKRRIRFKDEDHYSYLEILDGESISLWNKVVENTIQNVASNMKRSLINLFDAKLDLINHNFEKKQNKFTIELASLKKNYDILEAGFGNRKNPILNSETFLKEEYNSFLPKLLEMETQIIKLENELYQSQASHSAKIDKINKDFSSFIPIMDNFEESFLRVKFSNMPIKMNNMLIKIASIFFGLSLGLLYSFMPIFRNHKKP